MYYTIDNFLQYCDDMEIVKESTNDIALIAKKILDPIIKEFIRVLKRESLRSTHFQISIDNNIHYEEYEKGILSGSIFIDTKDMSDFSWNASRKIFKNALTMVKKKYEKDFKEYGITTYEDDGYYYFEIRLGKISANESIIEHAMESSREIEDSYNQNLKKMSDMCNEIDNEENISIIVQKLPKYLKLVEHVKSDISAMDYTKVEKIKMKLHSKLSKAVPLLSFIGTFAGITILNKKTKEKGLDELKVGGFAKFVLSAVTAGYSASKIGTPKDIKKHYLNELDYMINEIKLQEKIMKKLLSAGIKTISDADDYDIEVTENNVKVTKKEE